MRIKNIPKSFIFVQALFYGLIIILFVEAFSAGDFPALFATFGVILLLCDLAYKTPWNPLHHNKLVRFADGTIGVQESLPVPLSGDRYLMQIAMLSRYVPKDKWQYGEGLKGLMQSFSSHVTVDVDFKSTEMHELTGEFCGVPEGCIDLDISPCGRPVMSRDNILKNKLEQAEIQLTFISTLKDRLTALYSALGREKNQDMLYTQQILGTMLRELESIKPTIYSMQPPTLIPGGVGK